jgi:hypothetical protein
LYFWWFVFFIFAKAVFLASADAGLVVLSTLQHAKEKSTKTFQPNNKWGSWLNHSPSPVCYWYYNTVWFISISYEDSQSGVFFFLLFRWWASFIGQLHQQKKQSNLWALPKQIPILLYYSPFGLTYVGSRGEFFGQRIWDKVCDVMLLRTHWEPIGNLRNKWDHN